MVVHREGQKSNKPARIKVIAAGIEKEVPQVPYDGILHNGGFIIEEKGDVERVGINEEPEDGDQKDMDNQPLFKTHIT
jgi:hypothetical protein